MLAAMSRTTRNAPFGTDDTPDFQMKIVGGKRVQVTVDGTRQHNSDTNNLNLTWPQPRPGPHGTPSILTQPDWVAYDSRIQSGFNTTDQHNLARKISSYTSPLGDRSYSFKHGKPTLNTKAILPPIAATQSAGPYTYPHSLSLESAPCSDNHETLEKQVGRQLKNFSSQKLKDMYIDLTTFDRKLTGMVGEAQFSVVALRHDLPLKLSLLKIIFAKFVDLRDPNMLNYEKILQFLSDCVTKQDNMTPTVLNSHTRSKTSPPDFPLTNDFKSPQNFDNDYQILKNLSPIQGHTSPLRKEEEDKLVELISAQLSPSETIEVGDLRKSLREIDRLGKGDLPIHVIKSLCVRHRLPLTSSIITKLLQRSETTGGNADWRNFLEPLERVYQMRKPPDSLISTPVEEKPNFIKSRAGLGLDSSTFYKPSQSVDTPLVLSTPQWERKPLGKIRSSQPPSLPNSLPVSPPSTSSSMDIEIAQLPDGWDERELHQRDDVYVSPRNAEPWLHKFNKLAHALRTYHPYNKEILARDEAERVAKNYNLIYGLGFSEKKIENAVVQSLLPRKDGSPGNRVSVEALLELLEGRKRLLA